MKETFAGEVRKAIQVLGAGGREFSTQELIARMKLTSADDKRRLHNTLWDFKKAGYIERIAKGRYKCVRQEKPRELQQIMWSILRSRRRVTVDDLQELAGASKTYAGDWLRMLSKRGIVQRRGPATQPGIYHMIDDPVEMPVNDDKAAYLRELRAQKKAALTHLDEAYKHILEARLTINSIGEAKK